MKNASDHQIHDYEVISKREIRNHIDAYREQAFNHVHTGDTHAFTTEMSLIEDILDKYDPSIVVQVLGEIMKSDEITQEEIKAKYDTHQEIVRRLHILRLRGADANEAKFARQRDIDERWMPPDELSTYIQKLCSEAQKNEYLYTMTEPNAIVLCRLISSLDDREAILRAVMDEMMGDSRRNTNKPSKTINLPMEYFENLVTARLSKADFLSLIPKLNRNALQNLGHTLPLRAR